MHPSALRDFFLVEADVAPCTCGESMLEHSDGNDPCCPTSRQGPRFKPAWHHVPHVQPQATGVYIATSSITPTLCVQAPGQE